MFHAIPFAPKQLHPAKEKHSGEEIPPECCRSLYKLIIFADTFMFDPRLVRAALGENIHDQRANAGQNQRNLPDRALRYVERRENRSQPRDQGSM